MVTLKYNSSASESKKLSYIEFMDSQYYMVSPWLKKRNKTKKCESGLEKKRNKKQRKKPF